MRAHVVLGAFAADEVAEAVRERGFSDAGAHGKYRLFRRDDPARAVAVTDDAVLYGKHEDARVLVEAIADAAQGSRPRYHEVDEAFASLTETVGEPAVARVETTDPAPRANPEILQFEGSVGRATGRTIADGTEYVRHAVEFDEEADDRVGAIRETVADDEAFAAVEVSVEGKTVVVEGELDRSN